MSWFCDALGVVLSMAGLILIFTGHRWCEALIGAAIFMLAGRLIRNGFSRFRERDSAA